MINSSRLPSGYPKVKALTRAAALYGRFNGDIALLQPSAPRIDLILVDSEGQVRSPLGPMAGNAVRSFDRSVAQEQQQHLTLLDPERDHTAFFTENFVELEDGLEEPLRPLQIRHIQRSLDDAFECWHGSRGSMLQSDLTTAPRGTFLAHVRDGVVQFPPPLKGWCEQAGWTLFGIAADTPDRLTLTPVTADTPDDFDSHASSFDPQGRLWIPAGLRALVLLQDQLVMIRVEDGVIRIYLRKVFETLGFGP